MGNPPDLATHWSLMRLTPEDRKRGQFERWPDTDGVMLQRWPLSDLSLETVRSRWGHGLYRVQWFSADGQSSGATMGLGAVFELQPIDVPAPTPTDPVSQYRAAVAEMEDRSAREIDRAIGLVARLQGSPSAVAVPAAESAELARLRRENEELRLQVTIRAEIDRADARHREELAERDRRIHALEKESVERAASRDDDREPLFNADEPWYASVGRGIANSVAEKPERFLEIPFVQNMLERYMALQELKARGGVAAAPQLAPAQPAAPPPARRVAPPPAPEEASIYGKPSPLGPPSPDRIAQHAPVVNGASARPVVQRIEVAELVTP